MPRRQLPAQWESKLCEFQVKVNRNCWDHQGSVISGIRSDARNAKVGGKDTSRHLYGLAADCTFSTKEDRAAAWANGRSKGLRGYLIGRLGIHWQDRPAPSPTTRRA
jgi:hypothetical protein